MSNSSEEKQLLARGTDGVLYKLPMNMAEQHRVPKEEAEKLFAARTNFRNTLDEAGYAQPIESRHLPDFNILLQTEYE